MRPVRTTAPALVTLLIIAYYCNNYGLYLARFRVQLRLIRCHLMDECYNDINVFPCKYAYTCTCLYIKITCIYWTLTLLPCGLLNKKHLLTHACTHMNARMHIFRVIKFPDYMTELCGWIWPWNRLDSSSNTQLFTIIVNLYFRLVYPRPFCSVSNSIREATHPVLLP